MRPTHIVSWLAAPVGIWLGQLLFVAISSTVRIPNIWIVAFALAIYSLLFLPSYAIATALWYFLLRKKINH